MGSALLKGWVAQGLRPLAVVEPAVSADLRNLSRRHHILLLDRLEQAGDLHITACVVALKPDMLRNEAARMRWIAQSGALMLSIVAGTSITALRRSWGPGAAIVRAMPNLPGAIGKGISALYAPKGTSLRLRARARALLSGLGETLWLSREGLINAVTAVSGSGPAYVFLLAESLARAARAEGLPADIANRLARSTISGSGALLEADAREAAALRRDVTSPGGTTEAALKVLMKHDALADLIAGAVAAARARATELRDHGEARPPR